MEKRYFRYYTYIKPVLNFPIIRTYGLHILTLITLAIFIIFAIKPTVETILTLRQKQQTYNELLEKITTKSRNLQEARQTYQNLDEDIKLRIKTALPTKPDIKTMTQELEKAALQNQASISALQVQPLIFKQTADSTTNQTLAEISFNYNVEGSYESLLKVLDYLQTSIRLISIDNLIFNKVQDSSTILMSISGKVYYLE